MRHNPDFKKIGLSLGHDFHLPVLLEQALTHRSASGRNNERLEFLGDSLINFVIAEAAYRLWPKADEGDLSRWRASLVCEESLAKLAKSLLLSDFLIMGSGEMKSGGFRRESILADTFEALIGAVFLDGGFEAAKWVVLKHFDALLSAPPDAESLKDSKTRLQEYLQSRSRPVPEYQVLDENGPPHRRVFSVVCRLMDAGLESTAIGSSRKQAEQDAAKAMYLRMKDEGDA